MLHKTRLALAVGTVLTLGYVLPAFADGIVVEELPLSGNRVETHAIPKPGKIESAPLDSSSAAATGGNGGGDTGGSSVNPRWELYQQVQQLQDQVEKLQGTVEEQSHTIERMRSDQKARYTDLDQRVNTLNDRVTQLQQAPAPVATPSAVAPAESSAPSANIEEEKKAYLGAYEVYRSQGPDKAIPPMLTFVSRYPNSTFAPNAYYWLGEFYLAATPADMGSAKKNFETVLGTYPNNAKAPASLYKLGTIADLQKKPEEAKKRMQDVLTRYPNSPEAALAKAYLNPPADAPAPEAKPAEKPKAAAKAKVKKKAS